MMEQNSQKAPCQALALALSICLHVLLLLGAYYLPLRQSTGASSGYSITLSPAGNRQQQAAEDMPTETQAAKEQPTAQPPAAPQQVVQPAQTEPVPQQVLEDVALEAPNQDTPPEEVASPAQIPSEDSTATHQEEETEQAIDERGLYKAHLGKQAGALLELVGWVWDAAPQPQDDTEESGKIVFEIKIDELGEVIAVKTLEKTVSPLVEKIYKDALTELTFSKTADNTVYAPISTGKVTFILQAK